MFIGQNVGYQPFIFLETRDFDRNKLREIVVYSRYLARITNTCQKKIRVFYRKLNFYAVFICFETFWLTINKIKKMLRYYVKLDFINNSKIEMSTKSRFSCNKASGKNELPVELLKHGNEQLYALLGTSFYIA